jgi:hypothetical protein
LKHCTPVIGQTPRPDLGLLADALLLIHEMLEVLWLSNHGNSTEAVVVGLDTKQGHFLFIYYLFIYFIFFIARPSFGSWGRNLVACLSQLSTLRCFVQELNSLAANFRNLLPPAGLSTDFHDSNGSSPCG